MFGKLFNNKSDEKSEKSESVSKSILEQYLSTEKEIKYLEDKYDDFIVRSLEVEFEQYKQFVDSNHPRLSKTKHWSISEMKSDEFTLNKIDGDSEISVKVRYSFHEGSGRWELGYSYVKVGYNQTMLSTSKVNDIIFQYFIYWKLKQIEKERETRKQDFQKMIDIIGKDVKRDSLIDQILS